MKLAKFLIILLVTLFTVDASLDDVSLFKVNCTKSANATPDNNYVYELDNLLGEFITHASNTQFYNSTRIPSPESTNKVYGLYMCRGDITGQNCSNCVTSAKNNILLSCPYAFDAIIWYDNCMIRYSKNNFFGEIADYPYFIMYNVYNVTINQTMFEQTVTRTMLSLAIETANYSPGMMFGSRMVNVSKSPVILYAMEQCTQDLTKVECGVCLERLVKLLDVYTRKQGARVVSSSCLIRYEIYRFFGSIDASPTNRSPPNRSPANRSPANNIAGEKRQSHLGVIVSIVISTACIGILILFILLWICFHKKKLVETSPLLMEEMEEITTVESLQFEWNTIKGATRDFSTENKLGEGGFGLVYKGTLEDGQEIAVKRLSKNSGQGIVEFKTEIIVVAKLQHKNLVKLLGFCLAPKEKVLVYEYLHNSSLDRFISDSKRRVSMIWETRFKIIAGIAKGLLYLHEDSRLKIIHRDLKLSNILLDDDMNPKIADFGLARLFKVDQTQADTKRIVGSYGYMAPEYAMTGQFSVKSDVYSFGVIVLELVSGQRNRDINRSQDEEPLLHRAWTHWEQGLPLNLVDTSLGSEYPTAEVTKCIHIGLLCIQDYAVDRPRMELVVAAINGHSISLPLPKAPTFFGVPSTTDSQLYYKQFTGNDGDDLAKETSNDDPYIYSGSQGITDLYPR